MGITTLCIQRPVLATVLNLLLLLVGIVSFFALTVREYPNIDVPSVTVETRYPGASASIIESQVTKPLEDSLAGIEGIDTITSTSRAEESEISITFDLDRDPDAAAADVRDRVGRARDRLPDETEEPVIAKVEADARPIIYLAFSSDRHGDLSITDTADRLVKDRLQTISGVAEVIIFGERRYSMRIWLDPARLAAYDLTVQDVEDAIRQQNVELPAGRIEGRDRELTVQAETDLRTPEEFRDIILRDIDGYLIRLRDVAEVEIGPQDERRIARFKGRNAVALGIVKQATANPLAVSEAVRAQLPSIRALLPAGMEVDVAYDSTIFITASIEAVYTTIAEAVVLVMLVIFFFLRSFRAVLIPLVTIPLSLIGAFALMAVFGFSINTITLLAFVIAIGLVVDDAIVMLENIYRHLERGLTPIQAAFTGAKEIAFAIVSMTVTVAAVFVPVAFTTGRTGKLFTEFALTLAAAVLISGFIALTLSPMMCSRLLKQGHNSNMASRAVEGFLDWLNRAYRTSLAAVFSVRPMVLLFCGMVGFASWALYSNLSSELSPREDRGFFIGFFLGPEGATIDFMDQYARQLEGIYAGIPEAERYFVITGFPTVSRGISFIAMEDWADRERSTEEIAASVGGPMFAVPGIMSFPINPQSLGQSVRVRPVEGYIMTTGGFDQLERVSTEVLNRMRADPHFANPDSDLKLNKPELKVRVNRDKLAAVGVDVATIGRTLETMLGGRQVTRYKQDGEQYDVIIQLKDVNRSNPDDLSRIYVRGGGNGPDATPQSIQLSNLVTLNEEVAPTELNHFAKLRAAKIEASLGPGYSQGQALARLAEIVEEVGDESTQLEYGGAAREFFDSSNSLLFAFALAVLFVFLVMAAQFESWIDPLVVMFAVPLALAGALLAMNLTGGTLNIYSQIGLIALVGLITKNGILVVEFANQLREREGLSVQEAAMEAAVLRFRPVLMTALSLVLGTVPLALAVGAGAESRQEIGWVVVGGMTVGTLFTLYVVPVIYSFFARERKPLPQPKDSYAPPLAFHDDYDDSEGGDLYPEFDSRNWR